MSDEQDFEGYSEWLDDVAAEQAAAVAGEQYEYEFNETAKMLAGGCE